MKLSDGSIERLLEAWEKHAISHGWVCYSTRCLATSELGEHADIWIKPGRDDEAKVNVRWTAVGGDPIWPVGWEIFLDGGREWLELTAEEAWKIIEDGP